MLGTLNFRGFKICYRWKQDIPIKVKTFQRNHQYFPGEPFLAALLSLLSDMFYGCFKAVAQINIALCPYVAALIILFTILEMLVIL